MFGGADFGHETAETVENVNRRIMSFGGQPAIENDVSIEQRTHRIDDRVLLVVPLHQHGIKGGDRTHPKLPRPLHQPGQLAEDRRRIPLGCRRLSGSQADLPRRHGEPRERIQNQQHVLTLRRKKLRHRGCRQGRSLAHQRRLVGG